MFEENDVVRVKRAIPDAGIAAGTEGVVVSLFSKPNAAFLVEFSDDEGRTVATEALLPDDLDLVWSAKSDPASHRQAA